MGIQTEDEEGFKFTNTEHLLSAYGALGLCTGLTTLVTLGFKGSPEPLKPQGPLGRKW